MSVSVYPNETSTRDRSGDREFHQGRFPPNETARRRGLDPNETRVPIESTVTVGPTRGCPFQQIAQASPNVGSRGICFHKRPVARPPISDTQPAPTTHGCHPSPDELCTVPCSVACASLAVLPAPLRVAAHACWPSASSFDLAAPERCAGSLTRRLRSGGPLRLTSCNQSKDPPQ
jgi:hypothetical protein